MALILGIESTCDETAAAVVADGRRVLSNVISSQVKLHARYRGVVPEIACRAHLENILPVISESLQTAGVKLHDVDAVAVAYRPGLIGSLLIGITAAKTLAWSLGKPLVAVDHVHAHLYSVILDSEKEKLPHPNPPPEYQGKGKERESQDNHMVPLTPSPRTQGEGWGGGLLPMPAVGLVCSGGHTALYRLKSLLDIEMVGTTLDDAVGEAYDKVAAILNLGYPGGPILDGLAACGNPKAMAFPRALLNRDSLDFSFSGLKTSVLYQVRGHQGRERLASSLDEAGLHDVAASFQAACVDVLVKKIRRAVERFGAKSVIIGGGVSANRGLRATMSGFSLPVFFPPMQYCTDNAAMIAGLGNLLLKNGRIAGLDLDAVTYSEIKEFTTNEIE